MALNVSFQDLPKLLTGNPASNSSSEPDGKPLGLRLTPISNKLASLCHALTVTANRVSPAAEPLRRPYVIHHAGLQAWLAWPVTANVLFVKFCTGRGINRVHTSPPLQALTADLGQKHLWVMARWLACYG